MIDNVYSLQNELMIFDIMHQFLESCLNQPDFHNYKEAVDMVIASGFTKLSDLKQTQELNLIKKRLIDFKKRYLQKWRHRKKTLSNPTLFNSESVRVIDPNNSDAGTGFLSNHNKRTFLKKSQRTNITQLKKVFKLIGWKYSIEKLKYLYDIWSQFDYIRCDNFEQFKSHFFGSGSEVKPLLWYGPSIELSIWFCRLMNIGAINKSKYLKVMCSHFVLPGFIPVNYDSAVTNANKTLTSEIEEDRIDKIMLFIKE